MKKSIIMVVLAAASAAAFSAEVSVERITLGSGVPGTTGLENASVVDNAKVENNILHAPQYMPYFPTAATIWPRTVEVECKNNGTVQSLLDCEGYEWSPALGRGEYLFVKPVVKEEPAPVVITEEVPVVVEKKVLVEVPIKKKSE